MTKVLVVEDVDSLREVLCSVLETEGFTVHAVADAEQALQVLRSTSVDCILSDFKLPEASGLDFLRETRALMPTVPFLLMTAYGSIEIAVEAMKQGATDFICKPFEPQSLCNLLKQVIQHRRIVDRGIAARSRRERQFITQDPIIERLLAQARKVAVVDTSVLILGESGTGKELLARFIHEHSPRKDKPFVAINCAAMPATLLESEFFGHEAGAFTGATQARAGIFEVASEGTIFLDEVGEMSTDLQVKLLRALQEREVKRVGGTKVIKINPRVVAATNRRIDDALAQGLIREDFYYRLAVISFSIPPLRERRGDIDLLVSYYRDYFAAHMGKDFSISDEAWRILRHYPWPGNARELENVIERAAILTSGAVLPEHLGISVPLDYIALSEAAQSLTAISHRAARQAEIDLIQHTLQRTRGNKSKAAQLLGVSYKTLLNKVREYELGAVEPTPPESLQDSH